MERRTTGASNHDKTATTVILKPPLQPSRQPHLQSQARSGKVETKISVYPMTSSSRDPVISTSSSAFRPASRSEWKLLVQGAEARVWKLSGNDNKEQWICKERFSKAYRHPALDERLTKSRCRSEGKILEKCDKKSDIRVPKVIRVDPPLLYLEYLEGQTVKDYWKTTTTTTILSSETDESKDQNPAVTVDFETMAKSIGKAVGDLHNLGVVHGDLTTANMMLLLSDNNASIEEKEENISTTKQHELALIDFGLAKSLAGAEEQAVDLYVLERALQSTHPDLPEWFFTTLLEAYGTTTTLPSSSSGSNSKKTQQSTLQRLEQVRLRGRKRECFG